MGSREDREYDARIERLEQERRASCKAPNCRCSSPCDAYWDNQEVDDYPGDSYYKHDEENDD